MDEALPDPTSHSLPAQQPTPLERGKRRLLIRRFWSTAVGFWGRHGRPTAWLLSAAVLTIIVFNLAMLYAINLWNRKIFDGLQNHDAAAVFFLSLIYFPLLAASVASTVTQVYVRMTLQRRWRAWLNDRLIDRWLANGRYYLLNLVSGDHQNPEFRIAEDVRIATEAPVEFATGVTTAFLSAATFVVVLWTLGGTLDVHLGNVHIVVPGFLVVAAVLYALFGSFLTYALGRGLIEAGNVRQAREADVRSVLIRARENAEGIALMRGEPDERDLEPVGRRARQADVEPEPRQDDERDQRRHRGDLGQDALAVGHEHSGKNQERGDDQERVFVDQREELRGEQRGEHAPDHAAKRHP